MGLFKRGQLREKGAFVLLKLRQSQINWLLGFFFQALSQAGVNGGAKKASWLNHLPNWPTA